MNLHAAALLAGFSGIHLPGVSVLHDHGRQKNSPELHEIERANAIAGGAYGLEAIVLAGIAGVRYGLTHWRQMFRDVEGGRRRLMLELFGMMTFSGYMLWKGFFPRLNLGGIQHGDVSESG